MTSTTPPPASQQTETSLKAQSTRRRKRSKNTRLRRWFARHRYVHMLVEGVVVIAFALLLSLVIKTFLAQPFYIPSESMNDTLAVGDRVLVNKLSTSVSHIRRGDVIVFKDPGCTSDERTDENCWLEPVEQQDRPAIVRGFNSVLTAVGLLPPASDQFLVKRVIGVGGDHVVCCTQDGSITVNGTAITEPYLRAGTIPSELEFDVTVPADHYWVMGDNRQNSADSRYHMDGPDRGFVPEENVVGSVFVRMWPIDRWGLLTNPSEVFADVSS